MAHRWLWSVLLAGLSVPAGPAWAAKAPAVIEGTSDVTRHQTAPASATSCPVGSTTGGYVINYILPPNDTYYSRIDRPACSPCGPQSAEDWATDHISIALSFPVACAIPVRIAIVRAMGDPKCPVPDTTHVICGPRDTVLTVSAGAVALSPGFGHFCHLDTTAFLMIRFLADGVGCGTTGTRPRLTASTTCDSCHSYNYYPGGGADLCAVAFPGNPEIWTDAEIAPCAPVGVDDVPRPGTSPRIALIGPNPSSDTAPRFLLSLPPGGDARLQVFDLLGRRCSDQTLTGSGSGQELALHPDVRLSPGVYLARLSQQGRSASARFVVLR